MEINPVSGLAERVKITKNSPKDKNFEEILKNAQTKEDDRKLKEVCQEMESLFIHQMISQMRSTIPEGGFIEKSQGEKIFEDMLDEKYAQKISKAGGIGLAEILYNQLTGKYINKDE